MASMRDIKRRKSSIQSTGQITKAMKLVSTVKLQKAKASAEESKPYFVHLYDAINSMLKKSGNISHPLLQAGESKKKAVIVVSSNRGLAGGYNSNVVKLLTQDAAFNKEDVLVYAVGRKGRDALSGKGYEIKSDYSEAMNEPLYSDAVKIGRDVLNAFMAGEVGEIYLAYTVFKNTVSHIPTMVKLLPFTAEEDAEDKSSDSLVMMNYEPEPEEVLEHIIPKYVNGLIFGALKESFASENGARMQAMDSATNNAEEMIANLTLAYSRARQSAITQELTEIVAGANALD